MISAADIKSAARRAETQAGNGAPGLALLHFRLTPVDELVTAGQMGPVELQAAHEFSWVFDTITWDLRSCSIDDTFAQRQKSVNNAPPTSREEGAWRNYKSFANYWSDQRKRFNDPTLAVLVALVVDQRPLADVGEEFGLSEGKTKLALVRALRHYAARAGWADKTTCERWSRDAHRTFASTRQARANRRPAGEFLGQPAPR